MSLLELVNQFWITSLIGFLSATHGITSLTETTITSLPSTHVTQIITERNFKTDVQSELRTNPFYQQAALIGAQQKEAVIEPIDTANILVNIVCISGVAGHERKITGSGVLIDSQGVVLTNAHIAQFFLLNTESSDTRTNCTVQQGDNTDKKYEAELLYVSPTWITQNADQLYVDVPIGTGEYDFALLRIVRAADNTPLPVFSALNVVTHARPLQNLSVEVSGYPITEEYTQGDDTQIHTATTTVKKLFTFKENGPIDLISLAPSLVGYPGISGAPVLDDSQKLIAIVVTRGNTEAEGVHSLRALTTRYINTTLKEETGLDLVQTLSGDLALRAETFRTTVEPKLRILLAEQSN